MSDGLYLYCILNSPKEFKINLLGIDGLHQPYVIPYQEVGILVSKISLNDFSQRELERKIRNLEWLYEKANRHEMIVEEAMEWTSVIPIIFGTIFEEETTLKKSIHRSLPEIKKTFKVIKGHEEWGLKLYCDFLELRDNLVNLSSEVKKIEERLHNSNEETANFLKRRLEMELDNRLEDKALEVMEEIYESLATIATKSQLNELLEVEIIDDDKPMILNSVYLVKKDDLSSFIFRLKELEDKYSGFGFYFYYSGPWPPYNFSHLEFNDS
ncbi:GvpL/GvpF family gas vesicle protein [Selenihalanaerobacter shriftii]|uniref:Gas vesicle synthesis protein GvpL/GvpF n=1 Tax=Selenihalanaerobacter shriftii TaxID=142842 RepID=A0A1T4N6D8_9FIRM|nr:GvpL/GvpF family gas vesicle protein [Selenihalanaerobacter shriftii]SJZ74839.1 Gas vesicle synthesis protein GvpL/GvpF [Selenihalanaerobacter shriftii]